MRARNVSAMNFLNLNVDTLFEQHGVPEIDIVHKKIQAVVENKREELRTMVGERYRDLLQAADTITAMQDSSSTLIMQVDCITANCRSLNEQQLIGFKTSPDSTTDLLRHRNAQKQQNNYFSTMVQIKLLTSLPELIWSHIDQEHYFVATELFIFSRHISTGLQLDGHNPLMRHLPVAKKQWEILKPFHMTIKQNLLTALEREELTAEVATDCLLSLLLLEKSNMNAVLKIFLQLRGSAFLCCLNETRDSVSHRRRVKDRILASLKVLNSTMELLGKCFLDDGLMASKLAEYADTNSLPTLALMDSDDAQFSYMLPDIISNFRPKFEAYKLDHDQVRTALEQWLTDTQRIAGGQLKQLFELVSSMNIIQELKSEALASYRHLHLAPVAEQLKFADSVDFFEREYMPLINQRVRNIINNSCQDAFDTTYKSLQQSLRSVATQEDLMWLEDAGDLPLSLEEALNDDHKQKKLLMKLNGYTDEIISLCIDFDRKLASVVNETGLLLEEHTTKLDDKLALIEFLRETARTQLTHFISEVKALHLSADTPGQRKELLFVVRTLVALVELCPHLKICFCQQTSWRQWVGNMTGNSIEHWDRVCALLEEECFRFWQQLIDGILSENSCEQHLPAVLTNVVVLEDFANWETIRLEQKDEQDNVVHSTFHIPNQPRISLQSYLFSLIYALNAAVPQTMPSKVLHDLNGKLLRNLLQYFELLIAQQSDSTNNTRSQNVALQLYFDLKFLQHIFAITRDERVLYDQFQALQTKLKDIIDPFDYELFVEPLTNNVKLSVSRLQCLFGVLTPKVIRDATAPVTLQDNDPNVLSLSMSGSTALWFPLLPIITPNATRSSLTQKRAEAEKPSVSTPTRTAAATTQQRKGDTTASTMTKSKSFFGAMSQEWFR